MQTTLKQAVATQSDDLLVEMICAYMGRKLFSLSMASNRKTKSERLNQVKDIRENPMVQALPFEHKNKVVSLCDDCDELINEDD